MDINDYVNQPMMSYLGNKRKLISHITKYVEMDKPKTALDGFSGSGVVSRALKPYLKRLYINDLEPYSIAIGKAYLANIVGDTLQRFREFLGGLNSRVDALVASRKAPIIKPISTYYSPNDTNNISEGERCFYSSENGMRIDHYISLLANIEQFRLKEADKELFRDIAIGNLLVKCSIHTNTSGVFKGFYKVDGIGHWGGYKEHDLQRILRPIRIECPLFLNNGCDVNYNIGTINDFWENYNSDIIDFAYYDPPYNQHPYGSNYFMLNVIYNSIYNRNYSLNIDHTSVSGIPKDWTRSDFNYSKTALSAITDMIDMTNGKNILVSYSDSGMISKEDILEILDSRGETTVEEISYKNLNSRPNKKMGDKVNEYLFYNKLDVKII
jgi:adenine-specific DNA-methyltransferase